MEDGQILIVQAPGGLTPGSPIEWLDCGLRWIATVTAVVCLWVPGVEVEANSDDSAPTDDRPAYTLEKLGDYERQSVRAAIRRLDLQLVRDPQGRRIGQIHIVNLPVFSERDGPLQNLNSLHATTRKEVIRQEVLVETGQRWNRSLAEETERNLQNLAFSSVAVVVPVEPREAGDSSQTDTAEGRRATRPLGVLVVTRDIWSLRLNTLFEYQDGTLSQLAIQIAENNFLGRRKRLSANFDMDQGSYAFTPEYSDPNVAGSHWQIYMTGGPIFSRQSGNTEGGRGSFQLAYPIWHLDQSWGMQLDVSFEDRIVRRFLGGKLRPYDAPSTSEAESIPQRYELGLFRASSRGTYAFGESVRHEISAGYQFVTRSPDLVGNFPYSESAQRDFRQDILPRNERLSGPLVAYEFFRPTYVTYRNVDTFDLPETLQTGPSLQLEVAPSFRALGATNSLVEWSSALAYRLDLFEQAYGHARVEGSGRVDETGWYDLLGGASLRLVSPPVADAVRLVTRSEASVLARDGQNRLLTAGGPTGLRGYSIGALAGTHRVQFNADIRSLPVDMWSLQVGAVAFWDAAGVDDSWRSVGLFHDVGAGLRLLLPQANTIPLRIDWAFPLRQDQYQSNFPGRLSIGFGQAW